MSKYLGYIVLIVTVVAILSVLFVAGCRMLGIFSSPPPSDTPIVSSEPLPTILTSIKGRGYPLWLIMGGVGLFVFGLKKIGYAIMAAGLSGIVMLSTTAHFHKQLAVLGLLGLIGVFIYEKFIKDKALTQIVNAGQVFKEGFQSKSMEAKKAFNSVQAELQDTSTKKIVKQIKGELK